MAGVVYKPSKRLSADETVLLIRFYHGGKDCQTSSRISVPLARWNAKEQKLIIPRRFVTEETAKLIAANEQLERLRSHVMNAWLKDTAIVLSRQWLKSVIDDFYNIKPSTSLIAACESYIAAKRLSKNSITGYSSLINILKLYSSEGGCVDLAHFTTTEIEKFAQFLRTHPRRSENSVVTILHRLRSVINKCVDNGLIEVSPFAKFHMPAEVYGTPFYLTIEERDRLAAAEMPTPAIDRCRDVFIFQCHVGCRYSDIRSLTRANVANNVLMFMPVKTLHNTPQTVRVPLSNEAIRIIAKYRKTPTLRSIRTPDALLPWVDNATYNRLIREAMRTAGLDRTIAVRDRRSGKQDIRKIWELGSSHLARRTFAANLYRIIRDTRMVASMTGHVPSSKAFDRYVFIDDEVKRDILDSVNNIDSQTPQKKSRKNPDSAE